MSAEDRAARLATPQPRTRTLLAIADQLRQDGNHWAARAIEDAVAEQAGLREARGVRVTPSPTCCDDPEPHIHGTRWVPKRHVAPSPEAPGLRGAAQDALDMLAAIDRIAEP